MELLEGEAHVGVVIPPLIQTLWLSLLADTTHYSFARMGASHLGYAVVGQLTPAILQKRLGVWFE